jgi:hypothetical protein
MRIALLLVLVGCAGSNLVAKPLPELVANLRPTVPIEVAALQLAAGEALRWDVHFHGMTLGRAELSSGDLEVTTKFQTGALASSIAQVDYELTTVLDRANARPSSARETLSRDGATTHHEVAFQSSSYTVGEPAVRHAVPQGGAHTLHTALGAIRAWAQPDAAAGFLFVVHAGKLYHLTLARPIAETLLGTRSLKVTCRVRPHDGDGDVIALSIWLTATPERIPFRIAIAGDDSQLTADIVDE